MNLEPTPKMLALNAPATFFTRAERNKRLEKILYAIRFEEAVLELIDDQLITAPESVEMDEAYQRFQEVATGLSEAANWILAIGDVDIDKESEPGLTADEHKISDPDVLELTPFDGGGE